MKLNLFSWQPFCEFHVRQINSEGKNKCSLSAFFFFLTGFSIQDWNNLCGMTAQRAQTSEGERTQKSQEKPSGALKRHLPEATHTYISFHYAWSYWRSLQWLVGDLFTWILLQTLTTLWVRVCLMLNKYKKCPHEKTSLPVRSNHWCDSWPKSCVWTWWRIVISLAQNMIMVISFQKGVILELMLGIYSEV